MMQQQSAVVHTAHRDVQAGPDHWTITTGGSDRPFTTLLTRGGTTRVSRNVSHALRGNPTALAVVAAIEHYTQLKSVYVAMGPIDAPY